MGIVSVLPLLHERPFVSEVVAVACLVPFTSMSSLPVLLSFAASS